MKNLLLIVFVFLIISCNPKNENKSLTEKDFNKELVKSDFLKYADDSTKEDLEKSFSIYDENINKFATIDAEELTEYNFDFFLPKINRILNKRNISLSVKVPKNYEITNNIIIDNQEINLYTKKELENGRFWDSGPRNFFKIVNDIIAKKGSDEQFYLLYDGNDLSTLLLTSKQFEIIKNYYKKESQEIPYLP